MPLGVEIGLSPGDFVLDGDPAVSPKRVRTFRSLPIFGPCPLCLLIPLGTEVGLSLGGIVSDGNPAPLP